MKYSIFVLVAALALGSGCASIKQAATDRVDLGDGLIFDLVPVGPAFAAADKAAPGSGAVLRLIESDLKSKREAKLGPFGGLPYTTARQVILKTGVVIQEDEIAKIVRIRTPIVPAPVIDVVEPMDYGTQPPATLPIPEPTPPVVTPDAPPAIDPPAATPASIEDALKAISEAGK